MVITKLATHVVDGGAGRTWVFVSVSSDEGLVGTGEASQHRLDPAVVAQVEALTPLYVGQDPLNLIERRGQLLRAYDAHRFLFGAVSAIEQALWDLIGQSLRVPVYTLLGGRVRNSIPLYANVSLAARPGTPSLYAECAEAAVAEGFRAIKVNCFDSDPSDSIDSFEESLELAIARLAAVRKAIGPKVALLTDWSRGTPPGLAPRILDLLQEFDLFWIEEPFASGNGHELADLRRRTSARLVGGEQLCGARAFLQLFEQRAVDVIIPDVKWIGGLLMLKKVAAMAEAFDVEVAPHNMSGPIATAASAHLAATIPNLLLLEFCWGTTPWRTELIDAEERISGGELQLDDKPGLGMHLNLEAVETWTLKRKAASAEASSEGGCS